MLNNSNKSVVVALVLATILASGGFFAVVALIADIKESRSQIGGCLSQGVDYDRRILTAREFMLFSRKEQSGLKKIEGVFVDDKMPLGLINSLEISAKNSNVGIEFLPTTTQNSKNVWPSLKMEINIVGDISAILQFVEKIENSPYLAEIESVNIDVSDVLAGQSLPEILPTAGLTSPSAGRAHILLNVYAKI